MLRNRFKLFEFGIQTLRIPFKWFEFGFECPFEWLEFASKCFESLSKGLNLHSNASNLFQVVRIWIRMLRISFEWFEFALGNALNPFRMVLICIRMLRRPFECYEFGSSASNLVRML